MAKLKIVFAGTPDVAVPVLKTLTESAHEVVGVVTREDAPLGRKRVLTASPVASFAQEAGLKTIKANRLDADTTEQIAELGADIGVVVAYGGLLKTDLLTAPRLGWINLHFSALPKWRGAAPVQRALMAGETEIGGTIFRLVEELDAGAVVHSFTYSVTPGESAGEVLTAMALRGGTEMLAALEQLAENPNAGDPQDGEVSYAHKLTREDGRLDLTKSAAQVLAQWAGVTPEPGAFVQTAEQPLKIIRIAPVENSDIEPPVGEFALLGKKVFLGVSAGVLEVLEVQPAGKTKMLAADWLRGKGGRLTADG
ncbi:methionyl-tRNA formyltransferase [Canibacter zhoujuaniae]|uniref:methionyl-tRNA formyltransferase n=1 Tax=Canibacter zhoujuaniae TaxID=2708343 RepID=UPI00312C82CD